MCQPLKTINLEETFEDFKEQTLILGTIIIKVFENKLTKSQKKVTFVPKKS